MSAMDYVVLEIEKSNRLVYWTSMVAVFAALLMMGIKIFGWMATGSVSMLGALLDSLMDGLMSLVIFFSVRYAMQPADKEHRFGHGKAEAITAFFQGLILLAAGIFLFSQAVLRHYEPQPVEQVWTGVVVSVICIGITLLLVWLQYYTIRRTGSLAIRADQLHYMMDVLLYVSVIAALVLTRFFGNVHIDALFAIGISIYIGVQAFKILADSFKQLMDHELPDKIRQRIKDVVLSHEKVISMHALRTRMSGRRMVIQFHIEMDGALSLVSAHDIADEVEARLLGVFPGADVIIHQDPYGVEQLTALERN